MKAVNMSDVAREAGVSRQIASAVLNDNGSRPGRFSEATREIVLKAAKKIDYRRNRAASNFIQNRQGMLDVITPSLYQASQMFYMALIGEAKKYDQVISLSTCPTRRNGSSIEEHVRCLRENCCDAVILVGVNADDLNDRIKGLQTPAVRLNCNEHKLTGCINFDEEQGMALLLDRIVQRGRKNLVYLGYESDHVSAHRRPQIIPSLIKDQKLDLNYEHLLIPWFDPSLDHKKLDTEQKIFPIKVWFSAHHTCDAVIIHEQLLVSLYEALRQLGRVPGQDISVQSIHCRHFAQSVYPRCGGIDLMDYPLGELVVETANRLIAGEKVPPQTFPYVYHEGRAL